MHHTRTRTLAQFVVVHYLLFRRQQGLAASPGGLSGLLYGHPQRLYQARRDHLPNGAPSMRPAIGLTLEGFPSVAFGHLS